MHRHASGLQHPCDFLTERLESDNMFQYMRRKYQVKRVVWERNVLAIVEGDARIRKLVGRSLNFKARNNRITLAQLVK